MRLDSVEMVARCQYGCDYTLAGLRTVINRDREHVMGLFGPKQTPKAIGERSQAHIIARLLDVGSNVLTPYGDNTRYDLGIEDPDGNFYRIQCKTDSLDNNETLINFATV